MTKIHPNHSNLIKDKPDAERAVPQYGISERTGVV